MAIEFKVGDVVVQRRFINSTVACCYRIGTVSQVTKNTVTIKLPEDDSSFVTAEKENFRHIYAQADVLSKLFI